MIKTWSFAEEYKYFRKKILNSIDKTLKSGELFFGKQLEQFEKNFLKVDICTKSVFVSPCSVIPIEWAKSTKASTSSWCVILSSSSNFLSLFSWIKSSEWETLSKKTFEAVEFSWAKFCW